MDFERRINSLITERNILQRSLNKKEEELKACKEEKHAVEDARSILQTAAKNTQQTIEVHFSNIVTTAFEMIFDEPYEFITVFEERRNKTECDFWYKKKSKPKKLLRPKFAGGGGTIDIASFASRLGYWKLENSSPVLALDEPFKMVSKKYMPHAVEMLHVLAKEFNIQLIINTHIPLIAEHADKVFVIEKGRVMNDANERHVRQDKRIRQDE